MDNQVILVMDYLSVEHNLITVILDIQKFFIIFSKTNYGS